MGVNPTSIAELHFPEVIIDIALFSSRTSSYVKMVSPYTANTVCSSDVYNLAQKLENSVQIVTLVTHDGGTYKDKMVC